MYFEWDEDKDTVNLRKHGISFRNAARVFLDKNRLEIYDFMHSDTEDRYITIGKVHRILFVVYTVREANIRLISARVATEKERRLYYDR
jgi:uncharacterized DUF497 family protein